MRIPIHRDLPTGGGSIGVIGGTLGSGAPRLAAPRGALNTHADTPVSVTAEYPSLICTKPTRVRR